MTSTNHNRLIRFLKSGKNQRLTYGIGIILWLIIWRDALRAFDQSNIGYYLIQIILPLILLIVQLIFNRKEIWLLVIAYTTLYSLWILKNMIFDVLLEYERDYSPQPVWTTQRIKEYAIMVFILFFVNWLVWHMKPLKK